LESPGLKRTSNAVVGARGRLAGFVDDGLLGVRSERFRDPCEASGISRTDVGE
jgi:hypothetical protein